MSDTTTITGLGSGIKKDFKNLERPMPEWLETFSNQHPDNVYIVPFVQPEATFKSYCPKTGQPDSARIEIVYVPNDKMVESKSLKEYLQSFDNRGVGEFHEDVTNRIAKTLFELMHPRYLRVFGDFVVRGDLAIKPLVEMWEDNLSDKLVEDIRWLVASWDSVKR